MKLLTGTKSWPVTNWDPATAQKVTAALLAKYPKIDGIISNYGTDALASARAFQAAGRKLVPITTLDANGLSCLYKKNGHRRSSTISSATGSAGSRPARRSRPPRGCRTRSRTSTSSRSSRTRWPRASRSSATRSCRPDFYASNKLDQRPDREVREAVSRMATPSTSPRRSPPHGRRQDVPGRRGPERRDLRGHAG